MFSLFLQTLSSASGLSSRTITQQELKSNVKGGKKINPAKLLRDIRFVVLDTETTGLRAYKGDEVLSLGAVVIENGRIQKEQTFYQVVNPGRAVPKKITKLTGITEEMVQNKPDLTTVLNDFVSWADHSVLVGHVLNFDLTFINKHLLTHCGTKLRHSYIDTYKMAKCIFPCLRSYSLEDLCAYLSITCAKRHHALNDAISAARLLEIFLAMLEREGLETYKDFESFFHYHQLFSPTLAPLKH